MIHKDYICTILGRFEGKGVTRAYVPCEGGNYVGIGSWEGKKPYGASGVTIGTGFDLGQQSEGVLRALGLDPILQAKLAYYLGAKTQAAMEKLCARPLVLTAEEVAALDEAVHEKYINETAVMFGSDRFSSAPKQVQAVAVSLHYQFGVPARSASPSLEKAWDAMREGRYAGGAAFLRDISGWSLSHRQYMVRRRAEAALLDEAAVE